jgi:hypothetical protein
MSSTNLKGSLTTISCNSAEMVSLPTPRAKVCRSLEHSKTPTWIGKALDSRDSYLSLKKAVKEKKRKKMCKFEIPCFPPLPVPEVADGQARSATTDIILNKGLKPHRNNQAKNPRKKARIRYHKSNLRRRGQAPSLRSPTDSYQGEAHGIRIGLAKSSRV